MQEDKQQQRLGQQEIEPEVREQFREPVQPAEQGDHRAQADGEERQPDADTEKVPLLAATHHDDDLSPLEQFR